MKWSLVELKKQSDEPLQVDEMLNLSEGLMSRNKTITSVSEVHVTGILSADQQDVIGHFNVSLTVEMPSTRSLESVDVPLNFSVDEFYVGYRDKALERFDKNDVVIVLEEDMLNLNSVIEDNVLLQIPMQILTDDERKAEELPTGDDWEVLTEDKLVQVRKEKVDPRFASLQNFFDNDGSEEE
ncbi:YceD family protein [Dellaglioa sp. L3N]